MGRRLKPFKVDGNDKVIDCFAYYIRKVDMHIVDPFASECGRFRVDPMKQYGITPEDAEALVTANWGRGVLLQVDDRKPRKPAKTRKPSRR